MNLARAITSFILVAAVITAAADTAGAATIINVPADVATLQEAFDTAVDGDTVLVAPGVYTGGSAEVNVNIVSSHGPGATVIENSLVHYGSGVVEGFTFRNGGTFTVLALVGDNTVARRNVFEDNTSRDVVEINAEDVVVERNLFISNRCSYATISASWNAVRARIADNVVIDSTCWAIDARSSNIDRRQVLINNTLSGNENGIQLWGYPAAVRNNVILGAGGIGIDIDPEDALNHDIRRNLISGHDVAVTGLPSLIGTFGNIDTEPGFADAPGLLAYLPAPGSPLIDAGAGAGTSGVDFFGAARRTDGDGNGSTTPDIGAIESSSEYELFSGRVGVAPTESPIEDGCVTIYEPAGQVVTSVRTNAEGVFGLLLPREPVEVAIDDCGADIFAAEWFDDAASRDQADTIDLANGPAGISALVSFTLTCNGLAPTMVGTGAGETLTGTDGNDVIIALGGDDEIWAGPGDDIVCGGDGKDRIHGESGDDTLIGGPSRDWLYPEKGRDIVFGGDGNDFLYGSRGPDTFDGGPGTDRIDFEDAPAPVTVKLKAGTARGDGVDILTGIEDVYGSSYDDVLRGDQAANTLDAREGDDRLIGGGGDDRLIGGAGNDDLDGGGGGDEHFGGLGDDLLRTNPGNDTFDGGSDSDVVDYAASPRRIRVVVLEDSGDLQFSGHGVDVVEVRIEGIIGSSFDDRLKAKLDSGVVDAGPGDDHIEVLGGTAYGGVGNDTIVGTDRGVRVDAGPGDDVIRLRTTSRSVVFGGAGNDQVTTGDYDDEIDGGPGNDVIRSGPGDDTVWSGPGDDDVRGWAGDDVLVGGDGNDQLDGGPGFNVLSGGAGDDTFLSTPKDTITFELARDAVSVDIGDGTATGSGSDTFTANPAIFGSPHDDTILGDYQANAINGYLGDDAINGAGGDDLLIGSEGNDDISGKAGDDQIDGGPGIDTLHGGPGADLCINGETVMACEETALTTAAARIAAFVRGLLPQRLVWFADPTVWRD